MGGGWGVDWGWGRGTGGGGTYARFYIDKYIMTRCTLLLPRTETCVVFTTLII